MDPDVEDPGREGAPPRKDDGHEEGRDRATPRSWVTSGLIAGVIGGASIVVSATINPMFGRACLTASAISAVLKSFENWCCWP